MKHKIINASAVKHSKLVRGYVNYPLLITDGVNANVLPVGTSDLTSIIPSKERVIVYGENHRLDYLSITEYRPSDLAYIGSCFLQGDDIDNLDYRLLFEEGTVEDILDRAYADDLIQEGIPPMNAIVP